MRLTLFFTRSTSLRDWVDKGLFDREKMIYERHLVDGTLSRVVWLTYGRDDLVLAKELRAAGRLDSRIDVLGLPRWLPSGRLGGLAYSILMPFIQWRALRNCDLLKTNQLDGGWSAVIARSLLRKPLLLRCGYVQSKLETALYRLSPWRLRLMLALERFLYRHANLAAVTSEHNARYVVDVHSACKEKIRVVPNYIDETLFAPEPDVTPVNRMARVLYVGRLSPEKNLDALIKAVAMANLPLDIVGKGPEEARLRALISELGANVRMLGIVANNDLPALINRYRYFVLPSYFEGMPKTLLEAMACGVVCVGTDVDGINEVIQDGVDGFLAQGVDAEAICAALDRAWTADAVAVGVAARRKILARYTLTAVAHQESELFLEVAK